MKQIHDSILDKVEKYLKIWRIFGRCNAKISLVWEEFIETIGIALFFMCDFGAGKSSWQRYFYCNNVKE